MDASRNIYAVDFGGNAINICAAGTSTLLGTISGSNTQLNCPIAVEIDAQGRIYVTNDNVETITVYAPGARGNVAPIAVISGISTNMTYIDGFGITSAGGLVVADKTNKVLRFAPLFTP